MKDMKETPVHSSIWSNIFKRKTERAELESALRDMPPFALLKDNHLQELINLMHERSYVAGEYIFCQNDPGLGLYIITEGAVNIEYTSTDKRKLELAEFKEGDFFGELALIDGDTRSASAKAKTNCKIAVLFKPDLDEIIRKNPREGIDVLTGISKIIVTRLRNVNGEYYQLFNSYIQLKEELNGIKNKQNISAD